MEVSTLMLVDQSFSIQTGLCFCGQPVSVELGHHQPRVFRSLALFAHYECTKFGIEVSLPVSVLSLTDLTHLICFVLDPVRSLLTERCSWRPNPHLHTVTKRALVEFSKCWMRS